MLMVLLIYLLLATPVWGFVTASLTMQDAQAVVGVRMMGMGLMREVEQKREGWLGWRGFQALLRFLKERRSLAMPPAYIRRLVQTIRDTVRVHELEMMLRIGLDEAWSTAIAAGSTHATLNSALGAAQLSAVSRVQIIPDFAATCFCAHLRCIFSVTLGDIMLSVIKTALKSAGRRGDSYGAASHRKPDGYLYGKHPRDGGCEHGHR